MSRFPSLESLERHLSLGTHWKNPSGAAPSRALLRLAELLGESGLDPIGASASYFSPAHPQGSRFNRAYRTWNLKKRAGGFRTIRSPRPCLAKLQRLVNQRILAPLGAHPNAMGFVSAKSIRHHALLHVGSRVVVRLDIKKCFESISGAVIQSVVNRDLCNFLDEQVTNAIVDVCCCFNQLPTGAPTSPSLLNRVLFEFDDKVSEYAALNGLRYSRYADDLTFSGESAESSLEVYCSDLLRPLGLQLKPEKTRVMVRAQRQMVTGLVVNQRVTVPREYRRKVRAAVQAAERGITPHWDGAPMSRPQLAGRIEFLKSLNVEEGSALKRRLYSVPDWEPAQDSTRLLSHPLAIQKRNT